MYAIAIDFGGTKIKGAIVDNKGKIYATCRIPTQAEKGQKQIIRNLVHVISFLKIAFKKQAVESRKAGLMKLQYSLSEFQRKLNEITPPEVLFKLRIKIPPFRMPKELEKFRLKESDARKVFEAFEPKIKGVGISMPGFTDRRGKVIFGGGTLTSLVGTNLKKELEKKSGLPVFIENDANCFALAEAVHGAGKKYHAVFGVIWGTGIGGGLVIDKKIYTGAFRDGSEFGHIVVDPNIKKGVRCGCGQYGCLEMLASGKNIGRRYAERGGKIKNAGAREIYLSREKVARETIADAIHYFGIGIADVVNTLNPEIIVMGGSVSKFPNSVYGRLKREVKKYALPVLTKNLRIVRYKISADEGILGAAEVVRYSTEPRVDERLSEIAKQANGVNIDEFLQNMKRAR